MKSTTQKMEQSSGKRLVVRLRTLGERDRVLEFHPGVEGARLVGSAGNADVILRQPGILPVHCYFEREGDHIWLWPGQRSAVVRVNYETISGRERLGSRTIVELGESRMQVAVLEAEEDAPLHGPFGTEVIEINAIRAAVDAFETQQVDMQAVLGALASADWERTADFSRVELAVDGVLSSDVTDEQPTLEFDTRTLGHFGDDLTPPDASVGRAAPEWMTTTEPIPRAVTAAPTVASARVEQVIVSACIPLEPQQLAVPGVPSIAMPSSPVADLRGRESVRELDSMTISAPAPAFWSPVPAAPSTGLAVDPGDFATLSEPIEGLSSYAELESPSNLGQAGRSAAPDVRRPPFRAQLARSLGTGPATIAVLALFVALSLSALTAQVVRICPLLGSRTVISGGTAAAASAPRLPALSGDARQQTLVAAMASSSAAPSALLAQADGDPLVAVAVGHLLMGRESDAMSAYGDLALRYPSEPAYAAISKILRRRVNPQCRLGTETGCSKRSP